MTDDYNILSDDEECDDQVPPYKMTENGKILSEKEEGDDVILTKDIPDNHIIPSENKEGVELNPQNCKASTTRFAYFRKPMTCSYARTGTRGSQLLYISRLVRCTLSIVALTQVQVRSLFEKASSR